MNDVLQLLANPVMFKALLKLCGSYFVFSAFVGALPMPDTTSGKFYRFFFAFCNGLAANLSRAAVAIKVPGAAVQTPK